MHSASSTTEMCSEATRRTFASALGPLTPRYPQTVALRGAPSSSAVPTRTTDTPELEHGPVCTNMLMITMSVAPKHNSLTESLPLRTESGWERNLEARKKTRGVQGPSPSILSLTGELCATQARFWSRGGILNRAEDHPHP